jgi:CheY-like chemotaxis protein
LIPAKITKVLLVDDTKLYLDLERSFFTRQDCKVFTATSGIKALEIVEKEAPDLVMLDLYLPETDGFRVLKRIREEKGIKLVAIGLRDQEEDGRICRKLGVDAFLIRPVTKNDLIGTVSKLLNLPLRVDARIQVEMEVFADQKKEKYFGRSRDISAGGTYVKSEKEIKPGSQALLSFSLPGWEDIFSVESRCLRVDIIPREGKPLFGLAFQFVGIGSFEREKIEVFVDQKIGN